MSNEPGNSELTALFASDQLDSIVAGVAARIAIFHRSLIEHGTPEPLAHSLTLTFGEMAIGDYFGVDIPSSYGIGMLDMED